VGEFFTRVAVRVIASVILGGLIYWNFGKPSDSPSVANPPRPPITATSRPPAAQPTASTTPAATQADKVAALYARISDPALSYHLSGSGVSKAGRETLPFTLELDITGDDYSGRVNSINSSGKAQLVRRAGMMYIRPQGSSKWVSRSVPRDSVLQFTPFLDIRTQRDLQADGVKEDGQRTLYRYVSTEWYQPDVAHMMDLSRFPGRCSTLRLELLATEDSVPVSAHFECHIDNDIYSGTADYKFTDVGKSFTIRPPT